MTLVGKITAALESHLFASPAQSRTHLVISWTAVGGIFALFALLFMRDLETPAENLFWLNDTYDTYLVVRSFVMFGIALWMTGILVILFLSSSLWIRGLAIALIAVSFTMHLGYKYFINGIGFTLHDAGIIVSSLEATDDALATYGASFYWVLGANLAFWFTLSVITWRRVRTIGALWSLLLIPTVLIGAFFVWHAGGRHNFFPIPMRVPALLSANYFLVYSGPRDEIRLTPVAEPAVPAIIFVVDESVRADHLTINGYVRDTTPFLSTRQHEIANFGLASAAGNSSFSSIGVLFSGIRMDELDDVRFEYSRYPSLPQYSCAAGFNTSIVRGQYYERIFYNVNADCAPDNFEIIDATTGDARTGDRSAADRIVELVANQDKSFVFTQKLGAHFPYERRYPQDRKRFEPTIDGYAWSEDVVRATNSYDNAVAWASDDYFAYLLPQLEKLGKDVLLIYTSDHGQVIPGTFKGESATAAFIEDYPASALVPLFVWGAGDKGRAIVAALQENTSARNAVTHFEIFPTLLRLMGYDQDQVRNEYGLSLFDELGNDRIRQYIGGLMGVASAKVHTFKLEDVVSPHDHALSPRGEGM